MLDTRTLTLQLQVAAARVVEDVEADGQTVATLPLVDLGARVVAQLDDFATILGAITGRGRTAAGDALAERIAVEIGL
jgi:hypothetical protein